MSIGVIPSYSSHLFLCTLDEPHLRNKQAQMLCKVRRTHFSQYQASRMQNTVLYQDDHSIFQYTTVFSSIPQHTTGNRAVISSISESQYILHPSLCNTHLLQPRLLPAFWHGGGAWVRGYISCRADASDQGTWDRSYSANLTTGRLCTMIYTQPAILL